MKRLQRDVGAPLFRKRGRGVALTEAGEIVLDYAKRILGLNDELLDTVRGASLRGSVRLGFSQDFADEILPTVLARFSALYPLVTVELRIDPLQRRAPHLRRALGELPSLEGEAHTGPRRLSPARRRSSGGRALVIVAIRAP